MVLISKLVLHFSSKFLNKEWQNKSLTYILTVIGGTILTCMYLLFAYISRGMNLNWWLLHFTTWEDNVTLNFRMKAPYTVVVCEIYPVISSETFRIIAWSVAVFQGIARVLHHWHADNKWRKPSREDQTIVLAVLGNPVSCVCCHDNPV